MSKEMLKTPVTIFCKCPLGFYIKKPNVECRIEEMFYDVSLSFFPVLVGFLSHIVFKKWSCRPVKFKGPGPESCVVGER